MEVKEKYHFSFDQFDLGFSCMKVIYFDAFSGISGDMCLGALVDAGCPAEEIKLLLTQLQIPGFDLRWERVERGPLTGTKVHVMVEEEHHVHRHLRDILEITDRANFPGNVRETIEAVYTALAQAEGEVHGKPYDKIHFHEVGSFDAIVDISGTILALHLFGIEKVYCSRIHVGEGFASTHHGKLPIPVPATANLLRGFEIYSTGKTRELVTPTGAALMKVLAGSSTVLPAMLMQQVGYGAGTRNDQDLPNMLRVFAGEIDDKLTDLVTVIEANIDDMNPEFFEPLFHHLFHAGALDVTLTPITMKKGRPAVQLSVIVPPLKKEELAQKILQHTSSIGVRMMDCERRILKRESCTVQTPWGTIRGKVVWGHGVEKRFTPEYEDCRRIHESTTVPIAQVYQEAAQAYAQQSVNKQPASEHHGHHH